MMCLPCALRNAVHDQVGSIVDAILVSDSYWPTLDCEHVRHHLAILAQITAYIDAYAIAKKPRKALDTHVALGFVELDLHFDDGTVLDVNANPVCVSVLRSQHDEHVRTPHVRSAYYHRHHF